MGSLQELFAMRAFREKQIARYMETRVLVEAILFGCGNVAAALAGSDQSPSPDSLNDLMTSLKGLLLPELAEERDSKVTKVMKLMEEEQKRGPFKVESMAFEKRKKGLN